MDPNVELTFKGELITLPEMPEPYFWQVNEEDIDLRNGEGGSNLAGWTRVYNFGGKHIFAVVSRRGSTYTAGYRMPTWQAAVDYLAVRALLGGVEDDEDGEMWSSTKES